MGSVAVTNLTNCSPQEASPFPGIADPTIPLSENAPTEKSNWISILGIPDRPAANMALPRGARSAGMA